jgi:hypothetical protein
VKLSSAVLATLAVLAAPLPALAGVDLTWGDCVNESAVADLNFTGCTVAHRTISLYLSFKTSEPLPNFVAASLVLDLNQEGTLTLDPFWRFDDLASGGCNAAGLVLRDDVEPGVDGCATEINPWGYRGGSAAATITGFTAGLSGALNWGRLYARIAARPAIPSRSIPAPTTTWATSSSTAPRTGPARVATPGCVSWSRPSS